MSTESSKLIQAAVLYKLQTLAESTQLLSESVRASSDLAWVGEAGPILVVVPTQFIRSVLSQLPRHGQTLIFCAKGIEASSLQFPVDIARETIDGSAIAVLSGPTFAHEVAVIMQHGLKRMVQDQEDVYYYVTLMNENYAQPGLVEGDEEGILRGMYKFKSVAKDSKLRVQLMGSGTILREVIAAQELLEKDWGIGSDVWSVTSFTELRRDGLDCERAALLNPEGKDLPVPYVTTQLAKTDGPIVVSTDYIKAFGDQIRPFVPKDRTFKVLGTDGFGRSDYRFKLREHFEVDRHFVVLAALRALAEDGKIPFSKASEAIAKYGINPSKANPHHA